MTRPKVRIRFYVVIGVLAAFVLVLIWKLVSLMILTPSTEYPGITAPPRVERGPILDRNGRILAITTRLYSAHFWKPEIDDEAETVALLAEILESSEESIRSRLAREANFIWIERQLSPTNTARIREELRQGKLRGVYLAPEFGRSYPEQELGCHVVGFVDVDNKGRDGIEGSYNTTLSPETIEQGVEEIYGNQVFLTIDVNVQFICEEIAADVMDRLAADSVMVLVMAARTAEILAYVSLPGFDPNEPGLADETARHNRPARMVFEPGSVFKIVSIASFLQHGGISPEDRFSAPGYYELPMGERITDLGVYGDIDVSQIIKYSSNVGAAKASETIDATSFYYLLSSFGFGRKTGVPFEGERSGYLRLPQQWSQRSKPTLAFGHEISVTALQMLSAATVIANEGLRLQPILVKKVASPQGKIIKEFGRTVMSDREVVRPEVALEMLEMMESATEDGGTASRAAIEGMRVSAKSGTAQVSLPSGGYAEDRFIASFLGIFPTQDPRLIVYVVIENPQAEFPYGGIHASPVFREIAVELIRYYDIPLSDDPSLQHSGLVELQIPTAITLSTTMPDLLGAPKRLLLPLLGREDLRVLISGEGRVVRQTPAAGAPITEGMQIRLELE